MTDPTHLRLDRPSPGWPSLTLDNALTKVDLAAGTADLETALQWEALAQPVTMATADLHDAAFPRPGATQRPVPRH